MKTKYFNIIFKLYIQSKKYRLNNELRKKIK